MGLEIGIEVEKINSYSEFIRDAWNDYFWDFRVCQWLIRFTHEERTNYLGDLLNYFDDITHNLENFKINDNYRSALYDAVAVLQLMYIQQDLLDEMLSVFKLPKSSSPDKTLVRELRNELIGHPISRDYSILKSSVFITAQTRGTRIEYLRYHVQNDYKFETKSFDWIDIYAAHNKYLEEFLLIVIGCVKTKLLFFSGKIGTLGERISKMKFEKVVDWVEQIFERFHLHSSYNYSKNNILYCYQRREKHPRYHYAVDSYIKDLKTSIDETREDIDRRVNENFVVVQNRPFASTEKPFLDYFIEVVDRSPIHTQKRDIHYEFGKLSEKHPVFGVDYFIRAYQDDAEILIELLNMQKSLDHEAEYFCSYYYLKTLFIKRGLLKW